MANLHAEDTGPDHTSRNAAALARGAAKLGWLAGPTPRSVKSCASFGLCNYGCPTGAKQSTLVTYVPRAEKAGARVIAGAHVERARIEAGAVRVVDAVMADGSPLAVDASIVCLSAGVLATPAILQKSGIAAGDGVQCHGSVHVSARFTEEIHGYYGPTMAYAVREFADVAGGRGPGVMIENHRSTPWRSRVNGSLPNRPMAQLSKRSSAPSPIVIGSGGEIAALVDTWAFYLVGAGLGRGVPCDGTTRAIQRSVDPRTVAPLDTATILTSVAKTSRLLIAHEAVVPFGIGAEIAAVVGGEAFWDLDAPIERIGAAATPPPYAPDLERAWLPDRADVTNALRRLARV